MSQPAYQPKYAAMLSADLDETWEFRVRNALLEGGQRVEVGQDATIQISDRNGYFLALLLPGGGIHFTCIEEAAKAVERLGVPQT